MKCPGIAVLQAYIDCELNIGQKKEVEKHLSLCSKCSESLKELKENDDFVFGKMESYIQFSAKNFIPSPAPLNLKLTPTGDHANNRKGVSFFMLKYRKNIKKIAITACAILIATACITVQPVRSVIASTLSIFRAQDIKSINISLKDLNEIRENLARNESEIDIDQIGKIAKTGGQNRPVTAEEAKRTADFRVRFPAALGDSESHVRIIEPATVDFTLNVANINQVLKSFGATHLLPKEVDGKTFCVNFSSQVMADYGTGDRFITVMQTKSPEIHVPAGVDVDAIYHALIELPVLPHHLQNQLKSIKDWKNTLYVPVVDANAEEITINGAKGYVYAREGKDQGTVSHTYSKDGKTETIFHSTMHSSVIWYDQGTIYSVQGNVNKDEVIRIARSMR